MLINSAQMFINCTYCHHQSAHRQNAHRQNAQCSSTVVSPHQLHCSSSVLCSLTVTITDQLYSLLINSTLCTSSVHIAWQNVQQLFCLSIVFNVHQRCSIARPQWSVFINCFVHHQLFVHHQCSLLINDAHCSSVVCIAGQ